MDQACLDQYESCMDQYESCMDQYESCMDQAVSVSSHEALHACRVEASVHDASGTDLIRYSRWQSRCELVV